MKQERLNTLMILHVHKEHIDKMSMIEVANEFLSKLQRENVFGKFV